MISVTHYAFSYFITTAVGAPPETALAASLVSLLPDLDHDESFLGRIFPSLSKWLLGKYGHRGATHSVFALGIVLILFSPFLLTHSLFMWKSGSIWYIALVLAYASHIFIDLFNLSGVRLFAPYSQSKYYSFRRKGLLIIVASWKEYLLLFVIIMLAFTITGRSFSIIGAVRSVGKIFYKNYSSAQEELQENSGNLCRARVTYYDHATREKSTAEMIVLNMFQSEIFLLDNRSSSSTSPRLVIPKDDIAGIEILPTEKKMKYHHLSGSDVKELSKIIAGAFVSGTVTINNFDPGIRSSEFISVKKGVNLETLIFLSALPSEISFLTTLPQQVQSECEKLMADLPENREKQILNRINVLKSRIAYLNRKGFYSQYSEIMRYNKELQGLQTRLEALRMNQGSGNDMEVRMKIGRLREYSVSFNLVWVKFD